MIGDVEVEERIAVWLHERQQRKTWADKDLPHNWNFNAPIGHVQRGGDGLGGQLSLDLPLLDIDWYAADPDHAKTAARETWRLMTLELPRFVWPDGLFCMSVTVPMAPRWLPDPQYRRGATYQVILHGFIT